MHFVSLSPTKIVILVWWLVMHSGSLQSTLVKEVLEWEKHAEDIQRLMVVVITKITVESEFTFGLPLTYFRSTSGQNFSSHFFRILKHYERIESASYCNGQSSISCFMTETSRALPAARAISNFLEKAHRNKDATNLKRTKILTDMGQFITHDIIQTPDLSGKSSNSSVICRFIVHFLVFFSTPGRNRCKLLLYSIMQL